MGGHVAAIVIGVVIAVFGASGLGDPSSGPAPLVVVGIGVTVAQVGIIAAGVRWGTSPQRTFSDAAEASTSPVRRGWNATPAPADEADVNAVLEHLRAKGPSLTGEISEATGIPAGRLHVVIQELEKRLTVKWDGDRLKLRRS